MKEIPKRPPALISDMHYSYRIEYGDDNCTIAAIYRRKHGSCGPYEFVPPNPKPKWWQFWRWFELDPYLRW
jgi:hypothetical protein